MEVESSLDSSGRIVSWDFHNYNGGPAGLRPPYSFANQISMSHESESPLRQGSYRSLAAVGNAFARESHISEMASVANIDLVEFRLKQTENARLREVLERAADRFGWNKRKSGGGIGYGVSCNVEKGGHIALFTELEVHGSDVKLRRMVAAFDAGAVVNPDILSNQVEGAIVQGIGGALFEKLTFDEKRITNGTMARYRVPRFTDVPEIEVILINRKDTPSAGAGESPITATAPSIASAIYAATGKRVRQLPMLDALKTA
jgi:isoquinoline 1-oxidoreductase